MREKGKADEVVTFKITVQLSKVYVFFLCTFVSTGMSCMFLRLLLLTSEE